MVILVNLTGLRRVYWWPAFERQSDCGGVWYFDVRWLNTQITVYSREMGLHLVRHLNAASREVLDQWSSAEQKPAT